jgi:hypothetical protein
MRSAVSRASAWARSGSVWRAYRLAKAAEAHADLDAHHNHGKLILLP